MDEGRLPVPDETDAEGDQTSGNDRSDPQDHPCIPLDDRDYAVEEDYDQHNIGYAVYGMSVFGTGIELPGGETVEDIGQTAHCKDRKERQG